MSRLGAADAVLPLITDTQPEVLQLSISLFEANFNNFS